MRIATTLLTCCCALMMTGSGRAGTARAERTDRWLLRNGRVKQAYRARRAGLQAAFARQGLSYPARRVFIRVFKQERVLELWAAGASGPYKPIRSYPICAASGELGPKRRQGDAQVPEGFYQVRVFNPYSAFHLSLGIDYPNRADRILGHRANLGSAIMLHGACASIGCVAITDELIEEVYLAAAEAHATGRKPVDVHIFPTRLDAAGLAGLQRRFAARPALLSFWANLQPGYQHFERQRSLPAIKVDRAGRYVIVTRGGRQPSVAALGR